MQHIHLQYILALLLGISCASCTYVRSYHYRACESDHQSMPVIYDDSSVTISVSSDVWLKTGDETHLVWVASREPCVVDDIGICVVAVPVNGDTSRSVPQHVYAWSSTPSGGIRDPKTVSSVSSLPEQYRAIVEPWCWPITYRFESESSLPDRDFPVWLELHMRLIVAQRIIVVDRVIPMCRRREGYWRYWFDC